MCVNRGSKPPSCSMGPHHHPSPSSIRLLAIKKKTCYLWTHTDATGDYFWTLSPVFSKGRSRVWLTSRPSWTGWLANKTPWFQLTTYHRRQRTKREGNKNNCIVHCINTLEKKIHVHVSIKEKNWPNSQCLYQSARTHSGFTKMSFRCYQDILVFWWDGKREREDEGVNEISVEGWALLLPSLPL